MNSKQLEQHTLQTGSYGYSAVGLEDLGATEYTLVTVVVDVSGSVTDFKKEMENALTEIIEACKLSPRSDNLMIRIVTFETSMAELHGFKLLADCKPEDYKNCLQIGSTTALFDASANSISATIDYAKALENNDFSVNAIVVVITDGMDNCSNESTPTDIKKILKGAVKSESLESLITILVGVGMQNCPEVSRALSSFKDEVDFTQYIEIAEANAKTLAKLAAFISKSIFAQSNALGTGSCSQVLQF